jgi:predicted small secreted protein
VRRPKVYFLRVKNILLATAIVMTAVLSSACNTTIGLGRDMRILGENMENQANRTRGNDADTSGAPVY